MKIQNKNFLYNAIYQLFIYLIPLITVPYISRVLGVNNIGIYSYTYSIVYYFMLFSMIGINNYGAREIAKCNNKEETSVKFKSIYLLQLTLNIICIILYLLFVLIYNYEYKLILIIQIIFLISVAFDINWFFFGKEKFRITITRNIIIKILSLILIFILVKNNNDLWIYTLIMSITTLISQLYLWIYLRQEISNVKVGLNDIIRHLKPCLVLFIPVISYSIYRVMDKTMIGLMAGTIELGNYESAEKIINIPISFVTALGTVMLPHMAKHNIETIKKTIYESFELTFFMITPMIIGLILISSDFSIIFFGNEFIKTGMIIKILSITILFSGISNVIRTNYLIPLKKDNIYVISTIIGALVNLMCNIIFIRMYGAYGACIGTILAEFLLMLYQVLKTRNDISFKKTFSLLIKYLIKSLIMGAIIICIGLFISNILMKVIIQIICALLIYIVLNINYIKNDFFGKGNNNAK